MLRRPSSLLRLAGKSRSPDRELLAKSSVNVPMDSWLVKKTYIFCVSFFPWSPTLSYIPSYFGNADPGDEPTACVGVEWWERAHSASGRRVSNMFFGMRDFPWGSGFGILKRNRGEIRDWKVCEGGGMPKITLGITGLPEILGRDYGIEKPYWGPAGGWREEKSRERENVCLAFFTLPPSPFAWLFSIIYRNIPIKAIGSDCWRGKSFTDFLCFPKKKAPWDDVETVNYLFLLLSGCRQGLWQLTGVLVMVSLFIYL